MGYDEQSKIALEFAQGVKSRILGNDDDQRVCRDQPSQYYDFGTLFTQTVAEMNRQGDRSRFRPNSISLRFEVSRNDLERLSLELTPSFWLYFRRGKGEVPPMEWGDSFNKNSIWEPWLKRLIGPQMLILQRLTTKRERGLSSVSDMLQ